MIVLHNGSPVEMPWLSDVKGLLEAYLGGQAGGAAVANILYEKVNPSGKLAETMPLKLSDNPSYLNFGGGEKVEYREGVFVGYRYYDTKEMEAASEAISEEMVLAMTDSMPLRALMSFGNFSREELSDIIEKLNKLL